MLNLETDTVLWRLEGSTQPALLTCKLLGAEAWAPSHASLVPVLSNGHPRLPEEGGAVVRLGVGTPPWC